MDINSSTTILSPQDALVAIMIAEGTSHRGVTKIEFDSIIKIVEHLPIFKDYDLARVKTIAETVFDIFEEEDGLDALFGLEGNLGQPVFCVNTECTSVSTVETCHCPSNSPPLLEK